MTEYETWSAICGYEGLYEVSSEGRVRSLDRTDPRGHLRRGKLISPVLNSKGYQQVGLSKNGVVSRHLVSRLVLEAFVGECPNGMECCHGPHGKLVNKLDNLRWDTPSNNKIDQSVHGTARRKLGNNQVTDILKRYSKGECVASIARDYPVSVEAIRQITARKTWGHLSTPTM